MRAFGLAFALACACLIGAPAQASTLNEFVLFALDDILIQGGTTINAGLVGSAKKVTVGTNVKLNGIRAGGDILLQGETEVSSGSSIIGGGNLATGTNVKLGGVDVTLGGTYTPGGGTTAPASLATNVASPALGLPTLPIDPSPTTANGGSAFQVTSAANTLAPDEYGALTFATSGTTLNLSAGEYRFQSIANASSRTWNFDISGGPITVFVDQDAAIGGQSVFNLIGGTGNPVTDAGMLLFVLLGDFTVGTNANVAGAIYTALGVVNFGDDATIQGGTTYAGQILSAKKITLGTNVKVTFAPHYSTQNGVYGTPVPLPTALPLFATGLAAIGFYRWRNRRLKAANTRA